MKKVILEENPLSKLNVNELMELRINISNYFSLFKHDGITIYDYSQHRDVYGDFMKYCNEQKIIIKINEKEFKFCHLSMNIYYQILITQEIMERFDNELENINLCNFL